MAYIGMKYPVAGSKKAKGEGYENGFVIGKAIGFTGTPNKNDVKLYADDGVAETDLSIQDLGVSLNVDDIDLETQAKLLGHKYTEAGPEGATPEIMEIGIDDVAPKFGAGFYKRRRKNNITSFIAIFLYSVQFSEPTENANTKGQSTEFQTPTIEGTAFAEVVDGKNSLGKKAVFTDEAKAKAWLDTQAGIA